MAADETSTPNKRQKLTRGCKDQKKNNNVIDMIEDEDSESATDGAADNENYIQDDKLVDPDSESESEYESDHVRDDESSSSSGLDEPLDTLTTQVDHHSRILMQSPQSNIRSSVGTPTSTSKKADKMNSTRTLTSKKSTTTNLKLRDDELFQFKITVRWYEEDPKWKDGEGPIQEKKQEDIERKRGKDARPTSTLPIKNSLGEISTASPPWLIEVFGQKKRFNIMRVPKNPDTFNSSQCITWGPNLLTASKKLTKQTFTAIFKDLTNDRSQSRSTRKEAVPTEKGKSMNHESSTNT
jgi:hypothetical protein